MNCGYTCANNCYATAPAFYTMGNNCGYGNNGWCTFLLVIFIIFIICGVSKAL